jgi:hypothetical protein
MVRVSALAWIDTLSGSNRYALASRDFRRKYLLCPRAITVTNCNSFSLEAADITRRELLAVKPGNLCLKRVKGEAKAAVLVE